MTTPQIIAPKKLIEVALPLDEINKAAAREKAIRHGHPSTLHLWWARRPLAAARAVLFAQLVNDPAWKYTQDEAAKPQVKSAITKKRNELFRLIVELVQWESTSREDVLERARREIRASWRETCDVNRDHPQFGSLFDAASPPPFHDPFAGGGAIPLEAQRLGLSSNATDLNPVSVLLNKAMLDFPARFAGRSPVGPIPVTERQTKARATEDWQGVRGLAEDIRRFGWWVREKAQQRLEALYPQVQITPEITKNRPDLKSLTGERLTVIAWLWARTVRSPNPAFADLDVPLVSNFVLAMKPGKEAFVEPVVEKRNFSFRVRTGSRPPKEAFDGTKASGRGAEFRCLYSGTPITGEYIRAEGKAGRLGARLLAIVAEGVRGRIYLSPDAASEALASSATPQWQPDVEFFQQALGFRVGNYGLTRWSDLFTNRQLTALDTFCGLVRDAANECRKAAVVAGLPDDNVPLQAGGTGACAYGEAVAIYLALAVDRSADYWSSIATWHSGVKMEAIRNTFGRHAIPMTWDFAEANPFSSSSGNWLNNVQWTADALASVCPRRGSTASQEDARNAPIQGRVVSTDPPYFDNIGYADLSDFFYVWLRRSIRTFFPELFATISVPKAEELVATPARHGGKKEAESYFLSGMSAVMRGIATQAHGALPITIFYAFKQSDTEGDEGVASTGWETFLQAVVDAGLSITGTWPMRTELGNRMRSAGSNALASSIVLVCRPRSPMAASLSRKELMRQLNKTMPAALLDMTADPFAAVAPVDLAQAAIGPGMAIFSRYSSVLEADGSSMSVRTALVHINKSIDSYFSEFDADLDSDTRFCVEWFQQFGFDPGPFGGADVLARAKGTSVDGLQEADVLSALKGKVRLLKVKEYPNDWDPSTDKRTPIWEACHQMCRALSESESEAGALLAKMPEKQDAVRQLAYRLYTICERKGWAEDARAYNELVTSWPAIVEESQKAGVKGSQLTLNEID